MPTMLLDRPIAELFASAVPPSRPGPGGDAPDSGHGTEAPEDEEEEDEGNPS